MPRDIDIEPQRQRIRPRRLHRPEMSLSHQNRAISGLPQELRQHRRIRRPRHPRRSRDSVHIPLRPPQQRALRIRPPILVQRPVRDPMRRRIHPRHEADPRRRTDRRSIGIGELQRIPRHPFHLRRAIPPIQLRGIVPERHRRILPPHVIHQKEQNVGFIALPRLLRQRPPVVPRGNRREPEEREKKTRFHPSHRIKS